jgi:phosphatidyl-myo-inositol dimannoside synthase
MNEMKIGCLLTDAYGGRGGIAEFNRNFIDALASSEKVESIICLPRHIVDDVGRLPKKVEYRFGASRGKFSYLLQVLRLFLELHKFDVIFCQHIHLLPFLLPWILSKRFFGRGRTRFVVSIYGVDVWSQPKRFFVSALLPRVNSFLFISEITKTRFVKWSKVEGERFSYLPCCVDFYRFSPAEKKQELIEKHNLFDRKIILTIARLAGFDRYKGIDEIIEVLPKLVKLYPNICYLICGEGDDRKRLEEKVSNLGLANQVVFAGYISEEEKPDYYCLADLFAMPSRGEGFGIVYLEAMACGIPTLAGDEDGGREALDDGRFGILVDASSGEDVFRGICEGLERPRGRPVGLEKFSKEEFNKKVWAIL